MTADLLFYALVAAGLVFWLRSILGTRHGDERQRPNPFSSAPETEKQPAAFPPSAEDIPLGLDGFERERDLPRNVTVTEKAEQGLTEIARMDRAFDTAHFAGGAEKAFIMIVEAFAKGDRDMLQGLLSPSVFKAFDTVIENREKDGDTVETEIHAVRKIEIQDAALRDRQAYITVQFTADETCVIRNRDGVVTAGNPDRVTEMCDIWVFSRDVKSRDPVWELVETRDGDVEDHKTPLPDAS